MIDKEAQSAGHLPGLRTGTTTPIGQLNREGKVSTCFGSGSVEADIIFYRRSSRSQEDCWANHLSVPVW